MPEPGRAQGRPVSIFSGEEGGKWQGLVYAEAQRGSVLLGSVAPVGEVSWHPDRHGGGCALRVLGLWVRGGRPRALEPRTVIWGSGMQCKEWGFRPARHGFILRF